MGLSFCSTVAAPPSFLGKCEMCSQLINWTRRKSHTGRKLISSDFKHGGFQFLHQQQLHSVLTRLISGSSTQFNLCTGELHLIWYYRTKMKEKKEKIFFKVAPQNQIRDLWADDAWGGRRQLHINRS